MEKNSEKNPRFFLILLLIIIIVAISYVSAPSNKQIIDENKNIKEEFMEEEVKNKNKEIAEKKIEPQKTVQSAISNSNYIAPAKTTEQSKTITTEEDKNLLDNLRTYTVKNIYATEKILNKLLAEAGYSSTLIAVKDTPIKQKEALNRGDYEIAKFDFTDGKMYINTVKLPSADTKTIIANLTYEIELFNNLAKTCKSAGYTNFKKIFSDNNIVINDNFWQKAILSSDIKNFNSGDYLTSLQEFLSENTIQPKTPYEFFNKISKEINNTFETSSYEKSDNIYNYYRVESYSGKKKVLSDKFAKIYLKIHECSGNYNIAPDILFNNLYLKSFLAKVSSSKEKYNECIKKKDGDLTEFWKTYLPSDLTSSSYKTIVEVLDNVYTLCDSITPNDIAEAYTQSINSLEKNVASEKDVLLLRKLANNYLSCIKRYSISNPKQELKSIIMLICIENKLSTHSSNKDISLYYINIPQELFSLYDIKNKNQKFMFIYNNSEFIKIQGEKSKSDTLTKLLNDARLKYDLT